MKSKWLNELNSDWSWCIDFIGEAFPLDGVKLKDLSHGIIYAYVGLLDLCYKKLKLT